MADVAALMREALAHEAEGRGDEARALYEQVVAADAGHPGALLKLGLLARAARRGNEAEGLLLRAIDAVRGRGASPLAARLALTELRCESMPADALAWTSLGATLMEIELASAAARDVRPAPIERALAAFERAVALAPRSPSALAQLAMAARYACRWDRGAECVRALAELAVDPALPLPVSPVMAAVLIEDPALQSRAIADFSTQALPAAVTRPPAVLGQRGSRLRVGYVSADFHEHATAHLAAGLFEHHDRTRVTTFAYALDRDDRSAMRRRLVAAFDGWRDCAQADDAAVARAIADDALDVLVDLKGHTQDARPGILAKRPAPVQIHYLGFPGTLAYAAIDAQVADAIVVPPGEEIHYREAILRLPHCYQANDRGRPLPPAAARRNVGLPDDAIVLVSFNQAYKLDRRFVALWLDALADHARAVLWLTVPHAVAREAILSEAAACGVAAHRIVFAPVARQSDHLARLRCADLALDVLPYGSHTTGSDALWCGVPLLTLTGRTFAGRVGTSLVTAAGLPQLATSTIDDYRATLQRLLRDREELAQHRAHLERERYELPLFDTARFTRDFETMLGVAVNRR